eukprot:Blabericola_migrator_1__1860@NODE_1505_length_4393_cov_327_380490_g795_i1_p1_GENE_NODE_1505_length_4393_cov_327_380490_g795_i1NODE_1505_length_4393_cov_327_380490_g795_i1_p1_ORF_typecomplete_len754_score134_90Piwi/PF02171_17/8_6e11Piwi/PF02171_17/1_4e11PAZ/PF02170_22/6_6e05_NODE_1505_length_4393_cov_327_380490_g795_i11532414
MDSELKDLFRKKPELCEPDSDLRNTLRRRNLMCVTPYCPANIYKVIGVAFDKKPTDTFKLREKNAQGEWEERTESHIGYLRRRYGAQLSALMDPALDGAMMVSCVLLGRRKQSVKRSKTVFIPAPLLQVCCVNPTDLARHQREEITRLSQRKAHVVLEEIRRMITDLSNPVIKEGFEEFGLTVQVEPAALEGTNKLHQDVVISLCPPGQDQRGDCELYFDNRGSFERPYQNARKHFNPPILKRFCTIVRYDNNGQIPDHQCRAFFGHMEQYFRNWNWDTQYLSFRPHELEVHGWDGSEQHLEHIADIIRRENALERGSYDLVWGLLRDKRETEYTLFKRMTFNLGIPSQVITMQIMDRLNGQPFWKMMGAVAAKISPTVDNRLQPVDYTAPWRLRNAPLEGRDGAVAIGIATYQPSSMRRSNMGGFGLVAVVNDVGCGILQEYGESANISSGGIFGDLRAKFEKLLVDLTMRHCKRLDTLLIYRKGVSDSMFEQLEKAEVTQIEAALDAVIGKRQWEASERLLTLSQPKLWRQKGVYKCQVPCVVLQDGERRVVNVAKETSAVQVPGPDGSKKTGHLELQIKFEEHEGTPDLHSSHNIVVELPDDGPRRPLDKRPGIIFIVVNHSHQANLLFFSGERDAQAPPGTIINDYFRSVSLQGTPRNEFFIIPSVGPSGFAGPVHYSIITNRAMMEQPDIELASLRFCHLYYNQQGSIKTPFMLRFAEKGAEKLCTLYQGCASLTERRNRLRDTHFLL